MMSRLAFWIALFALATYSRFAAPQAIALQQDCGDVWAVSPGPFDYTNPADHTDRARIPIVEQFHFTQDVESLKRGVSNAHPLPDIDFTLRHVPNHHRALNAAMRFELEHGGTPPQYRSVECWFERALRFKPDDGMVWLLYGNFWAKKKRWEQAVEYYRRAAELMPDNPEVDYNLGLVYLQLQNYSRALEHAKAAYAAGYPLQGLRKRLAEKGFDLK